MNDCGSRSGTGAASLPPLRVLGAVALVASVGTVAVGRLLRRRRLCALELRARAALDRLELARAELDRQFRQADTLTTRQADRSTVARSAVRDLNDTRARLAQLIHRAEEARLAFTAPASNPAP